MDRNEIILARISKKIAEREKMGELWDDRDKTLESVTFILADAGMLEYEGVEGTFILTEKCERIVTEDESRLNAARVEGEITDDTIRELRGRGFTEWECVRILGEDETDNIMGVFTD